MTKTPGIQPDPITHLIDATTALTLALRDLDAVRRALADQVPLKQDGLEFVDEISTLVNSIERLLRQAEQS